MRKTTLLATSVFLALGVSAHAADLSVAPLYKAPAVAPVACTTNQCNVWFLGLGVYGAAANANVIGGGLNNSIFANGEMIGASIGGQFWTNGMFLGAEDIVGYSFGPTSQVGTVTNDITGGVNILWLEAGGSLGDFFGSGAAPVAINSALLSDLISPYFGTGPAVAFGGSGLGSQTFWTEGAGVRYLIPNASHPLLLDVKYLYGNNTSTNGLVNNKNFQFVGASVAIPFNW
jgi:hypothetical protein